MTDYKRVEAAARVLALNYFRRNILCLSGITVDEAPDFVEKEWPMHVPVADLVINAADNEPEHKAAMEWVLNQVEEFDREHTEGEWVRSVAALKLLRGETE